MITFIIRIIISLKRRMSILKIKLYKFYIERQFNSCGENLKFFGPGLPIIHNPQNIIIGKNVRINEYAFLFPRQNATITLGNNVTISAFAKIITAKYDLFLLLNGEKNFHNDIHADESIEIGNDCWIASGATILPGVRITGTNVVIGAGTILTKSFHESNVLIAGNPGKIIKKL